MAVRAKAKGLKISITEASYAEHLGMQTAIEVHGSAENYVAGARSELRAGMCRKWGDDWKSLVDRMLVTSDGDCVPR